MTEFLLILPEIFLALTLALVVAGEITYHGEDLRLITITAILGLGAAFVQTLITYQYGATQLFEHTLSIDGLSLFFKLIFILLAGLSIFIAMNTKEVPRSRQAEYVALVLASALGMCLAASSADLLLAFLSLQFTNVLAYFLAGYGKRSILSAEAAVKYMIFSAVAGALLLYGLAILFAHTQSLNIYEIHRALVAHPLPREVMLVVFMLTFLSFSFQFGAFPMYLWAPDVLEGSPTPAAAFLSISSRAVGFAVALRFFVVVFAQPALTGGQWQVLGALDWTQVVAWVAGLTMITGSLLAFRQNSAKRMVGCLVVAESGYLLMGLLVLDEVGIAALLYNLVIQLFALMGTFYVLSFFFDEVGSDRLEDLRGMLRRAVPEAICLVLFLLCLVGLPPTPGFIGKFTLIGVAIRHQWPLLAMTAVATMALSSVAVARLAYHLVGDFRKTEVTPAAPQVHRRMFLGGLISVMLVVGVFAEFLLDWTGKSLGFILW